MTDVTRRRVLQLGAAGAEHAVDAFGPARLMFGSDWPVCLLAVSYQRWIDVLEHSTRRTRP